MKLSPSSYLLGSALVRTLSQFILVSLATVILGNDQTGQYALALALTAPIFVCAGLSLNSIFFTLKYRAEIGDYESALLRSYALAIGLVVLALAFTMPQSALLILVVALTKVSDGFSDLYALVFQKNNQHSRILSLAALKALITVVAAGVAMALIKDITLAMLLSLVVSGLFTIFVHRVLAHRSAATAFGGPSVAVQGGHKSILKAGLTVGVSDAVISLGISIPQYVLAYQFGSDSLVPYIYALYILTALELVLNARVLAWLKLTQNREGSVRTEYLRSVVLVVPLGVAGILGVGVLAQILDFESTFHHPLSWAAIILASFTLPIVFLKNAQLLQRNFYGHTVAVSIFTVVGLFLLSIVLVPPFGIPGALLAFTLGTIPRLLAQVFLLRRGPSK